MKMDSSSCLHSDRNLKGEKQYEKDDDSCDDGGVRAGRWAVTLNFINTSGGFFDILMEEMDSLSLQKTLLERRNYAGGGMGVSAFCLKEVA